jgi:hypothetical protein
MYRMVTIFCICLCISGCAASYDGIKLSNFSYNHRYYNSLIKFRIPHYGIAGNDGCSPEDQISLSLKSFKDSQIVGYVKDATTLKPISRAKIEIYYKQYNDSSWIVADSTGGFIFTPKSTVASIFVDALFYRALFIDFKGREIVTKK